MRVRRPGRMATPTALKILRGNPGRRPLNKREPRPAPKRPSAPAILDPVARQEWRRACRVLGPAGLVTQADRSALAAYCVAWSRWLDAEAKLKEFGPVLKSPTKGFPMLSPYLIIANTAMAQLRGFLAEFGMTPASRSRIQVDTPEPPNELDAFKAKHG